MHTPNILQKAYNSFLTFRSGRPRRSNATAPVGPLRGGGYPAAAAAAKETACPGCGNDSAAETYNCQLCHEECCSECADVRDDGAFVVCNNCLDKSDEEKSKQALPAAATEATSPSARIASALPGLAVAHGIIRADETVTPAACAVHHSAQAVTPRAAVPAAPVAVAPAVVAPVQDRAFFQALEKNPALSNLERWNVTEALSAIDRGEKPARFLSQRERDEQIAGLYQVLNTSTSAAEIWRVSDHLDQLERGEEPSAFLSQRERDEQIAGLYQVLNTSTSAAEIWRVSDHLDQLERGENPGAFVPGSVIDARLAALENALENESDPKERARLASQLDAVANGAPFISREQAAMESAALESQLAAATCPRERYRLAEKLDSL